MSEEPTEKPAQDEKSRRNDRKTREGLVVSDKMNKTIVVELEDRKKHRRYAKVLRSTSKVKELVRTLAGRRNARQVIRGFEPPQFRKARLGWVSTAENQRDIQELT